MEEKRYSIANALVFPALIHRYGINMSAPLGM